MGRRRLSPRENGLNDRAHKTTTGLRVISEKKKKKNIEKKTHHGKKKGKTGRYWA